MKKGNLIAYFSVFLAMLFWSYTFIWYKKVYEFYNPVIGHARFTFVTISIDHYHELITAVFIDVAISGIGGENALAIRATALHKDVFQLALIVRQGLDVHNQPAIFRFGKTSGTEQAEFGTLLGGMADLIGPFRGPRCRIQGQEAIQDQDKRRQ